MKKNMHTFINKGSALPFALFCCIVLSGCQTPPKTLYQWESYQPQVYEHFKGQESAERQIIILQEGLDKIRSTGGMTPPGYHAHLGMLYASVGKDDQMVNEFETEKTLFPESAPYMDFLLKSSKK